MQKFKPGRKYSARSVSDYIFKIHRRTEKCVWVTVNDKVVRRAVSFFEYEDTEYFLPFGRQEMAAMVTAG